MLILCALICVRCAQPGKITGGDKDEQAPRILSSEPQNGALNFSGNQIDFSFDEYVEVNTAAQKLVVAPPLNSAPTFSMRGKNVTVKWEDTLRSNSTYVFNFGDGIVDVNERNPLDSNLLVFSTGSYIDSFEVRGKVVDALTGTAEKDVLVLLYDQDVDSLHLTTLPRYFGKTNEGGDYSIAYMAPGSYKVFALKAENNGYLFDLPSEEIAFSDQLFSSYARGDSTAKPVDPLRLFLHADTLQFLKENDQLADLGLRWVFNQSVDQMKIRSLFGPDHETWMKVWSDDRDTLEIWFTQREDYDSLGIEVKVDGLVDTLRYLKPSKFAKDAFEKFDKPLKLNQPSGKIKYYRPFTLSSRTPFEGVDLSTSLLIEGKDSMSLSKYAAVDSLNIVVSYDWKPDGSYKLFIPGGSVCDRFGQCMDTLKLSKKALAKVDEGELIVRMDSLETSSVLVWQLLKTDGKVSKTIVLGKERKVQLPHVATGSYQMRLILDDNGNGEWDPGEYTTKRLPEEVIYYEASMEIRPNWTEEIVWNLKR